MMEGEQLLEESEKAREKTLDGLSSQEKPDGASSQKKEEEGSDPEEGKEEPGLGSKGSEKEELSVEAKIVATTSDGEAEARKQRAQEGLQIFYRNLTAGVKKASTARPGQQALDTHDNLMILQLLIQEMKLKLDKEESKEPKTYSDADHALFEGKRKEMLERIAETMYNSLYKYLDYLNHCMTFCSDAQVEGKGCPYPKCKKHGVTMCIGDIREHLAEECTKIELECNRCAATFKRPWKDYHDCITVYQERLLTAEKALADKEDELDMLKVEHSRELQELKAEQLQ